MSDSALFSLISGGGGFQYQVQSSDDHGYRTKCPPTYTDPVLDLYVAYILAQTGFIVIINRGGHSVGWERRKSQVADFSK
jgi:hypothetical protein